MVDLEAPEAIAKQYAPIAQKRLALGEQAKAKLERNERRAKSKEAVVDGNLDGDLRQWREAIGLSVSQAAEDIGVSKATISRIENGGRISGEVARKVRVWLDSVAS